MAQFENFRWITNNSYFVGEFTIYTVPLVKNGYSVRDKEFGQMIFVSSKLPKAERANVVKGLIAKRRAKQAEVENA